MAQNQYSKTKMTQNFLNASYPQSNSLSLSRRYSSSQPRESARSSTTLSQIQRSNIKKIQVKKQDHTVRTLLCIVAVILLIIICIDINSEIKRQFHRHQLQAQHCFSEYVANQCDNPVEVVRQKCKELQICYSTPNKDKIKISSILGHLIGHAAKNLTNSAGIFGTMFLVSILCAILFFAYKSSKASIKFQKH